MRLLLILCFGCALFFSCKKDSKSIDPIVPQSTNTATNYYGLLTSKHLGVLSGGTVTSTYGFNGAFFSDVGNIWFIKKGASPDPEEIFKLSRLADDLAVGLGTGIRMDFGYFVVRTDFSYKAKDPSPSTVHANVQNQWFGYSIKKGSQFQIGLSYPFIL